jgi:ribosomal protein L29
MMMIENACNVPSVLRRGIMAIAFCVLPMGLVDAQDFNAIERKLEEAIDAGDLSRKDAAIMLNALKRSKGTAGGDKRTAGGDKRTAGGDKRSDRDLEAKKRRYLAYAKEIDAAVKAGKLSREEADKKLIEVRTKLFRNGGKKPADKGDRRGISVEDYRRGEAKIQDLVKTGVISREDAVKRLTEMRKLVVRDPGKEKESAGDKGSDRDLEAKKRRYMAFVKEIEAAVKSGDLSKEEAEKKLISVRKEMFSNGDKKPATRKKEVGGDKGQNLEAKKRRYDSYARKIETAVKSGDLSKEEAEKKLIEMRKQLFSKGG